MAEFFLLFYIFFHCLFTSEEDLRTFVGPVAGYNLDDGTDPSNSFEETNLTGDISPFNFPIPSPQNLPDFSIVQEPTAPGQLARASIPSSRSMPASLHEAAVPIEHDHDYPFDFPEIGPLYVSENSACKRMLGRNSDGRYPRKIASNFMQDIVKYQGANRNMVCKCIQEDKMICEITVARNSLEHEVVRRRLDRSDPDALLPFWIATQERGHPIMFEDQPCIPPVYAIIELLVVNMPPRFDRSQSDPYDLHYPIWTIPIKQCTDAVCPISQEHFRHNQIIYVLKSERDRVLQDQAVVCISATGLRQYAASQEDRTFRDPLKREGNRLLSIETGYDAYVISIKRTRDMGSQTDISGPIIAAPQSEPSLPTNPMSQTFAEEHVSVTTDRSIIFKPWSLFLFLGFIFCSLCTHCHVKQHTHYDHFYTEII